jgi:rhodanese-related sulfurtransferase
VPRDIGIDELDHLLSAGAQLIEVLPAAEFDEEHLPEAINLPLRQVSADGVSTLDRSSPVVVYCSDSL